MRCPGRSVAAAAAAAASEAGLVVRGWAEEELSPGSKARALVRPVLAEAVGRVEEAATEEAATVVKRSADVRPKGKVYSAVYN